MFFFIRPQGLFWLCHANNTKTKYLGGHHSNLHNHDQINPYHQWNIQRRKPHIMHLARMHHPKQDVGGPETRVVLVVLVNRCILLLSIPGLPIRNVFWKFLSHKTNQKAFLWGSWYLCQVTFFFHRHNITNVVWWYCLMLLSSLSL